MPVRFDEYDALDDEEFDIGVKPGTNGHRIMRFLLADPEVGFTPTEIHEGTGVARGSIGKTLARLEERQLVRHSGEYWAAEQDDRIATYVGMLLSMDGVEGRFPPEDAAEWLENAPNETE